MRFRFPRTACSAKWRRHSWARRCAPRFRATHRGPLGAKKPSGWHLALAASRARGVRFGIFIAIEIAEPYLVEELAREGAGASRRNAGAFGKAVTEAPLLVTLVWGAFSRPSPKS